jgi:catechol 2,3-dioxygenase-like lactoylglutathione lyase family enzyme
MERQGHEDMARITERSGRPSPLVDIRFISHGTLDSVNLQESRRFYEEVFGFEVIQLSKVSLLLRKGSEHTYVVVETGNAEHKMSLMNHNGIDVASPEEVDRAHATLSAVKEEYRIRQIHPVEISTECTPFTCWTWTGTGGRSWPIGRVATATPTTIPAAISLGGTILSWATPTT